MNTVQRPTGPSTVPTMFRHVVMFRWSPDATDEAKAAVTAGLAELPGAIDAIRAYRFGPDHGLAETNFDYVVVADFDDEAAYLAYRDDETHQQLIRERIAPIVAERVAVQYVIDD